METKEIKINCPEGYEIDNENSTFECIKFKPVEKKRFIDNTEALIHGYLIDSSDSRLFKIASCRNISNNYSVFATEKQARSALAMARISQIMANDERFGGVVTDEEWGKYFIDKYVIERNNNMINCCLYNETYYFLAFHTKEQRNLFLKENEQLVKDYLMIG